MGGSITTGEGRIMNTVVSADGTSIAFERFGDGQPIILITAALCDRSALRPLAEQLEQHAMVINYDRRGRGDSGEIGQYTVEREIEDLAALLKKVGGTAAVYGHSSGAALALHAAAYGLPITKLVLHEPPFALNEDDEQRRRSQEIAENIKALLAQERRRDAVELFLTTTGMPPAMAAQMSDDPAMRANAHTIPYDPFEILHVSSRGGATPIEQASGVTVPTLALAGGASFPFMIETAVQLSDAMPSGRHVVLDGQEHVVAPDVLAPVLAEFLADA
jgi:pimeloyl-ACP methyl ester carboxylesterase